MKEHQAKLKKLVTENEKQYGAEIREKYGEEVVEASNARLMSLSPQEYEKAQELSQQINTTLKLAFAAGDPAGPLAQHVCALHKEWLCYFWPTYSKEAHLGLAQMYVHDPRFMAYYDSVAPGCAQFLRDALAVFCK